LTQQLAYSGLGDWITLAAGEWGHGFANLHTREACIFLSRTLAGDIRLVSRYFVDHYVLNFVLTEWAMLHASCVVDPRRQRLVVMVAAHNTGKSTTALRLMRAGYTFLADGMALFRRHGERVIVGGYPIGEVKLRDDVLAWFTGYSGEAAREQQKTIVDLRAVHPDRVSESLLTPSAVQVCFVDRGAGARTQVEPIDAGEAGRLISANTVFWNDAAHLKHNAETLRHLLGVAGLHRLRIGADESSLVTAIDELSE
jgi:hypothetical protein